VSESIDGKLDFQLSTSHRWKYDLLLRKWLCRVWGSGCSIGGKKSFNQILFITAGISEQGFSKDLPSGGLWNLLWSSTNKESTILELIYLSILERTVYTVPKIRQCRGNNTLHYDLFPMYSVDTDISWYIR
jgi:hypothetical protein